MNRKNLVWYGVSTALILVLIYLADVNQFIDALFSANIYILLLSLVAAALTFVTSAYVWHGLFKLMEFDIKYFETLRIHMASRFVNNVTPAGQFGGQPFMAYVLSDNTDIEYENALATIVSSDLVTALPLISSVFAAGAYLFVFDVLGDFMVNALRIALFLAILVFFLIYILWYRFETVESLILKGAKKLQGLLNIETDFVVNLEERLANVKSIFRKVGSNPEELGGSISAAFFDLALRVGSMYLVFLALGLTPRLPYLMLIVPLTTAAKISPTPGGSGTHELATAGLIAGIFPVSFATALTIAVLYRIATYWQLTVLGYFSSMTIKNLRTNQIKR